MNLRSALLAAALTFAAGGPASAQERLALKGGRVIPVSGAVIDQGTVLIRDGKIEAVGKNVLIPADARVIDAAGKVIVPGFIEVHSSRGMDQVNETNPNVPFLSVVDAIDPSQDYFEECRRNGVTAAAIVPGNNTMFGGQAAIVKTAGTYVNEMVMRRGAGIKISLRPPADRNRMGHLASLRRELSAARDGTAVVVTPPEGGRGGGTGRRGRGPGEAQDDTQPQPGRRGRGAAGPTGPQAPADADAALIRDALTKLLKGEMLAFVYCELAMDVPHALALVADYKLKAILVLGPDCYKAAKQVAAAKLPVVLDPTLSFWETDPRTAEDRHIALPKVYREAGINPMFQVTGFASGNLFRSPALPPTVGTNYLWYQAATAVKYGTPPNEALATITLRPAQALGIDKLIGSIEVGKDADVVVLTGDPLKLETWVQTTIVGGKVVYDRDQDRKLKQLLQPAAK